MSLWIRLYMDVAACNERIMGPTHVENVVDLAVRIALSYRTVSHITFPVDFQEMEVKKRQRSKRNIPHHTSRAEAEGAMLANPSDLDRAAEILNAGTKIAILAGRGALHAAVELEQIADKLGAPIVKALLGRGAVPDDSVYTTGTIGLLGTRPSHEAMESCDTLLMVGTSFPTSNTCPSRAMPRVSRSNLIPNGSVSDFQWMSDWWATVGESSANCCPGSHAKKIEASSRRPKREWKTGVRSWKSGPRGAMCP